MYVIVAVLYPQYEEAGWAAIGAVVEDGDV